MKLAGKVLTESVLTEIGNLSLDVSNCHAHGYDEAGSVSGHINGLSANILRINKKAVYTHHSEKLNLVAATCSIQCVRNVPDQIKDRSFFFTFTKPRQKNAELFHRKPCSRLPEEEIDKCLSHKMG